MKQSQYGIRYAAVVIGFAVFALMAMELNSRVAELRRLAVERDDIGAKVTEQVQTQVALLATSTYVSSDAAVRQWAHLDGHMIKPGEHPVVPLGQQVATPVPTPVPDIQASQTSHLENWIALFFGPQAP